MIIENQNIVSQRFDLNSFITVVLTSFLLLFSVESISQKLINKQTSLSFFEAKKDFDSKDKNLRKWDAPVIADLDQDGYPDMVLNDHGLGLSICWNNNGKFAKPYDLIMGDLHGVSVGDFDRDGNLELAISRGGGSGGNARNSMLFRVSKQREFSRLEDFGVPFELMRGRTLKFFDGDNDGDLDLLDFAFPSKEKKGKSENYIYKNDGKGQLILVTALPPVQTDGQKTLLTDVNSDGITDILLYGHGHVKAYQGKEDLTFEDWTSMVLPYEVEEVTDIAELDYDNDGDFDLYVTRGKDFEIGETFYNKETKTWGFYTKRGKFQFEDLEAGEVLNMGNFQSQWPYNDAYYIGETGYPYNFPGETHSGKDIRLINSDALGFPDKLNEKGGIHIGYVGNDKWRVAGSTQSPTTGTIQGVLAYPEYDHPKGLSDVLLENKNGKFIDVTQKANLFLEDHTVGVSVADFDNNGLQDIIVVRRGEMVFENEALIYLNKGDSKFELLKQHGLSTSDIGSMGMALAVLDYNLDGWVDVILGNERGKWHLFRNSMGAAENGKFITVEIGNSPSGKATALGALVSVSGCKNEQMKRVGSTGAQYSLSNNNKIHFGLGQCDQEIRVIVTWTNGESTKRTVTSINNNVFMGKKI